MDTREFNVGLNTQNESLDLKVLINILLNRKFVILITTISFAILSAILSRFLITPVYKTTFTIAANVPDAYPTKYGDFVSPITSNADYINLIKSNDVIEQAVTDMGLNPEDSSIETLSNNITLGSVSDSRNIYTVTIKGSDPVEIVEFSHVLYEKFTEYVDLLVKERAINYFYNTYSVNLESSNNSLQSYTDLLSDYEDLLEETPPIINQEEMLEALSPNSEYIILDDVINPNYTELENLIFETESLITTIESEIQTFTRYVKGLGNEIENLEQHYAYGSPGRFETSILNTSDVFILSDAMAPNDRVSPNIIRNAVVAGSLGLIIGAALVIFKSYMNNKLKL